jgi:hypothetical protein
MAEVELVDQFVASFGKLDHLLATSRERHPIEWNLRTEDPDENGWFKWHPIRKIADTVLLDSLYAKLPARFPPLYEQLVLSYRWATIDLESFRLLANPPGDDLAGLLAQITADDGLQESLIPAGYMQFGQGPDVDYDPVCFDIKSRTKSKDYRIVKIDHEEILCNYRVKVVAELAPSFEQLVIQTIEMANSVKK